MFWLVCGGGLLLALSPILIGYGERDLQDKELAYQDRTITLKKLSNELLFSRRVEKDFLLKRRPVDIERHAEHASEAQRHIDALKEQGLYEEALATLEKLSQTFKDYRAQFKIAADTYGVVGLNEEDGLRGSLRASIHAVEDKLKQFDKPRLGNLLLMMRRHEKDFLLRLDPKYIDRMAERKQEYFDLMPRARFNPNDDAEIRSLMDTYHVEFNAMAENRLKIAEASDQMDRLFQDVDPQVDRLRQSIEDSLAQVREQHQSAENTSSILTVAVFVLILFGLSMVAYKVGADVTTGMTDLNESAKALANQDSLPKKPMEARHDEIASIYYALAEIEADRNSPDTQPAEEKAVVEVSETVESDNDQVALLLGQIEDLETHLGSASGLLVGALESFKSEADHLNHQVSQDQAFLVTAHGKSKQTMDQITTAARSISTLDESIHSIVQNTESSSQIAEEAVRLTRTAGDTVAGLAEAAEKIGEVVRIIDQIAMQTNLLALNATIEAAQAGAIGRGFAVVAEEIKKLSRETSNALGQISEQVNTVQTRTESTVKAITGVDRIIQRFDETVKSIESAVSTQNEANANLSSQVQAASESVAVIHDELEQARDKNAQVMVGQLVGQCESLSNQARNIQETSSGWFADLNRNAQST